MADASLDLPEGDPSGSESFARFRYQAKLTLLHWLGTLSASSGLIAVYAEHVEDILLEYSDSLRFIQVKTRAPSVGPWTADHMCSDGGGVDSLCRAYVLAREHNCTFELHLEGGASPSSATRAFIAACSGVTAALRSKIMEHLEKASSVTADDATADDAQLTDFLSRLKILPNQPSQRDIDAKCIRMLARLAPGVAAGSLEALYWSLLAIVEAAQEARPPGLAPDADAIAFLEAELALLSSSSPDGENPRRLTRDRLQLLVPGVPPTRALLLLERVLHTPRPLTALEEKMATAGASDTLITDARNLRAMAEVRRMEWLSGPSNSIDHLSDLCNRVLVHARAVAQRCTTSAEPAADIWAHLVAEAGLENLDQFGLFNRDRQSLVGLLCCLSDECRFPWTPA